MDVSCPSLPPKILSADRRWTNTQTTGCMAAHGCHFAKCSLYVLLVNIEIFSSPYAIMVIARTALYKVSIVVLSRTFLKNKIFVYAVDIIFDEPGRNRDVRKTAGANAHPHARTHWSRS